MTVLRITPTLAASIADEMQDVEQRIRRRAYELSRTSGPRWNDPLANWVVAERELVWQPPIEVRQTRGEFQVLAAVPGIEPADLDLRVSPSGVLITAVAAHSHAEDDGAVRVCEFSRGQLFRAVHFPERIDSAKVTAEYRNGVLRIVAPIVVSVRRKPDTRHAP